MIELAKFTLACLGVLLPILGGIAAFSGNQEVIAAAICFGICLVLTAICILLQQYAFRRGANWQMAAVLGGSLGRCGLIFGIAIGLGTLAYFKATHFVVWIAIGYFVTLIFESVIAYRKLNRKQQNAL